jgi:hypothetical protein
MSGRLASGVLVGVLLRRVNNAGGMAMVLARGDSHAGAILVVTLEKGENPRLFERGIGATGAAELIETGPKAATDLSAVTDYWRRRRARDPDLWVIELDIPFAERFAAETILGD